MSSSKKKSKKIPDLKDVLRSELDEIDFILNWWLPKATDESSTPTAAKTAVDVTLKLITFKNTLLTNIHRPDEEQVDPMINLAEQLADEDEPA
jgi:hypothetical protein